jgi:hypothetical protein
MAVKVFTKEEKENISVISLPKAYQRGAALPLDPSTIFASLADAQDYVSGTSKYGPVAFAGQIISVADGPNSAVTVYSIDVDGSLIELGRKEQSLTANNYSAAVALATQDNLSKIVSVANDEVISGETYTSGLYIITGVGTVAKIATTTATGDISGAVAEIQGKINTLEDAMYWQTDEDD